MNKQKMGKLIFWGIIALTVGLVGWLSASPINDKAVVVLGGNNYLNIYDEDTLGSNDALGLVTQQSVKAYIDSGTVTMTNKTLTSPTINTPTITDPVLYHETYQHKSKTGALTWAVANGEILLLSGSTPTAIALPTITAAMNGYELTIKNVSGATTRTLTPTAGSDAIEATQGTMTGTSDTAIDAAGDCATFIAIYITETSGVSSVWIIKQEDIT